MGSPERDCPFLKYQKEEKDNYRRTKEKNSARNIENIYYCI